MIVHLLIDEKFTSDFIELVDKEFNKDKEHIFLIVTKHQKLRYEMRSKAEKVFIRQDIKSIFRLTCYLIKAKKIIVHGLFNSYLIYMFYLLHVSHKVIWAIWGGDLYDYNKETGIFRFVKTRVIQKFHGATTPIEGDVELARKVYGFKGKYYPCLLYMSNVLNEENENQYITEIHSEEKPYTIIIGNSADSKNRHEYILNKIKHLNLKNVRFIIPLSYGSQINADKVEREYEREYGKNAIFLRTFMPKEKYLRLLSEADVVLFAHQRQQGVGNLIQLIDSGAKIYLESHVTTFTWLRGLGIKIFDFEMINEDVLKPLSKEEKENNRIIIRSIANRDNLIQQLKSIFTYEQSTCNTKS